MTSRRWRTRYGTVAIAVLALATASACTGSSPSSAAPRRHPRRRRRRVRRRGDQLPADRDALHQRHGVRAAIQLEPARHGQLRDGHAGAHLRAAVPVRPAEGHVRSLAGDGRHQRRLEGQHLRHQRPPGREVERRPGANRRGRRLLDQPRQDERYRPVLSQRVDGRECGRQRQHGHGHLQGDAGLHRVHGLPVEGPGPAAARLVQVPREPDRDRRERAPGRHRPDDPGHLQRPGGRVPDQAGLVGHQRARPELQVQVPGGRGERLQRPGARPADRRQHRLEQQLPARHQPAHERRRRQLRLHPQDLLPVDAVHAVGATRCGSSRTTPWRR